MKKQRLQKLRSWWRNRTFLTPWKREHTIAWLFSCVMVAAVGFAAVSGGEDTPKTEKGRGEAQNALNEAFCRHEWKHIPAQDRCTSCGVLSGPAGYIKGYVEESLEMHKGSVYGIDDSPGHKHIWHVLYEDDDLKVEYCLTCDLSGPVIPFVVADGKTTVVLWSNSPGAWKRIDKITPSICSHTAILRTNMHPDSANTSSCMDCGKILDYPDDKDWSIRLIDEYPIVITPSPPSGKKVNTEEKPLDATPEKIHCECIWLIVGQPAGIEPTKRLVHRCDMCLENKTKETKGRGIHTPRDTETPWGMQDTRGGYTGYKGGV